MKKANENPTSKEHTEKSVSNDKCPHGHRFGIDVERYDDCDDCEIWQACADTKFKNRHL